MEKSEVESYLSKLREACLFYVKGDALALGAMVTLASTLKFEQKEIINYAISNVWLLVAIGFLIACGMLIESEITTTVGTTDTVLNAKKVKSLRTLYRMYVGLQVAGLTFFLGWTAKSIDLMSKAI